MDKARLRTILSDQRDELTGHDLTPLCARKEESQLSLTSQMAQVVIGVRRSGKSTLCEKYLRQNGVIFAYINFDDDRLTGLQTADFDNVLDALYQVYGNFTHLFLDEAQNVDAWQLFVNRLLRQRMHIFLTGSNSKLLSTELTTHLTGRHNRVELYPFSYSEYCTVRGVDISSLSTKAIALRKNALRDYLTEGGMPELLHEPNRRGYIESLLASIIKNDIGQRFRVRHTETLRRIAAYLADNFCQEFVASELAGLFGISDHTVDKYYAYLREAFLFVNVPKFSYKSRDRVRYGKVYVVDLAFVSDRDGTFSTENWGWRLENVVCIELLRRYRPQYADIFYHRDRTGEVDFIVAQAGRVLQLVQVCYDISSEKTFRREVNGLIRAAQQFHCTELLLLTLDEYRDYEVSGLTIHILPAAEWLAGLT